MLLVTAGFSLLAVSIVSTVASTTDLFTEVVGTGIKWLLPVLTVAVVGTFLTLLFRYAATGQHSFRRAAPGGFALAVMWQRPAVRSERRTSTEVLVDTTSMTKTFGLVLGLVGFLWIGAVMAVLAMEINVVISRRLWPRALLTPFTDAVELTAGRSARLRLVRPDAAAQGLREGVGDLGGAPRRGRRPGRPRRPLGDEVLEVLAPCYVGRSPST